MNKIIYKISLLFLMVATSLFLEYMFGGGKITRESALISCGGTFLVYIAVVFYKDYKNGSKRVA